MDSVEESSFDERCGYAFKQVCVLQHIRNGMLCIAYKRHGCTGLMRALPAVEGLVCQIVLHCVYEHGIYITSRLLFKLVPSYNVPVAHKSQNLFVPLYFDK